MFNLLFLIFFFYKVIAYLPRLQDGGCIVVEDRVYYLGGYTSIPNIKEVVDRNQDVFTLNLKNGLKVINNSMEWKKNEVVNYPRIGTILLLYSTIENGTKTIASIYQSRLKKGLLFNFFNIEKNEWYGENSIENSIENMYLEFITDSKENRTCYQRYFIFQDENRDKLFYVSGCSFNINTRVTKAFQMKTFNIETKEIKFMFEPPHNMTIHQLFISNNKLYYFLDLGLEDRKKSGQNKLYELDLKSKDVKEYDIKLKHNDYFEPIKYNQSVYFIRYEKGEDANFLGDVY